MSQGLQQINDLIKEHSAFVPRLTSECSKHIVGNLYVLERLLIGILSGGHILLEGVPGLAKTLSIKTLASACAVEFKRIQFTPDLLPSDLIGTLIYNPGKQVFTPKLGPIFSNFVLADEINRAPAKVQSALLEAMQENQVTIGDKTYKLPRPFLVLATQNPIDQEGTYALPEAQIDRFLMKLKVDYPDRDTEKKIIDINTTPNNSSVDPVVSIEELSNARRILEHIYVDDKIKNYVLDLVRATRAPEDYQLNNMAVLIAYGASPRASLSLIKASRAHAFLKGRGFVTPEDIKVIGKDVLRHRIIPSFEAEAEDITSDIIIERLFSEIEVP